MSLKYKITFLFALALLFVIGVTAFTVERVVRVSIETELEGLLNDSAKEAERALNREVKRRGFLTNENAAAVILQSIGGHANFTKVEFTYWEGNLPRGFSLAITPYGNIWTTSSKTPSVDSSYGTFRREYRQYLEGGMYIATLALEVSSKEADKLVSRLLRIFLFSAFSVLILLIGLTYYLADKIVSSPLWELWYVTQKVSEGNLDISPALVLSKRSDEIGALASAFQRMLLALRRARSENESLLSQSQTFNKILEKRVEEARSALEEKKQALDITREQLSKRERFAALGQLAGSIAHELGTPLSTLSGYIQLVQVDSSISAEVRESLDVAAGEAKRMTKIIKRFLDSTKGISVILEPVDMQALIKNAIELAIPSIHRGNCTIIFDPCSELSDIMMDSSLLSHILINILKNAKDAAGINGTIWIETTLSKEFVEIFIEDSGSGVPYSYVDKIFEPFFTTKSPEGGTGLGLAICQEMIRALQGKLTLEQSVHGSGARFLVQVPF